MKPHHLETFRAAGAVKRYHIVRTLRHQSVAEHSWNVALLVYMIYPQARPKLIKAALTHDVAEITTGDVPATAKWKEPKIKELLDIVEAEFRKKYYIDYKLTSKEYKILKWCDMMELVIWCQEEMELGNKYATPIHANGVAYLEKVGHPTKQAEVLFHTITSHWRQHGIRK